MLRLPTDCLLDIFCYLDVRSLRRISVTCKRFRSLVIKYSIQQRLIKFPSDSKKWSINLLPFCKRIYIDKIFEKKHWNELIDLVLKNVNSKNLVEFRIFNIHYANIEQLQRLANCLKCVEILHLNGDFLYPYSLEKESSIIFEKMFENADNIQILQLTHLTVTDSLPENLIRNLRELSFSYCHIKFSALLRMVEMVGNKLETFHNYRCSYDEESSIQNKREIFKAIVAQAPNLKRLKIFSVTPHSSALKSMRSMTWV